MNAPDIRLNPGEALVWSGRPQRLAFALGVFRLRAIGLYALFLAGLQIWRSVERGEGVAGAIPFALLVAAAFAVLTLLAWRTAGSVSYVATNRRLVLRYGVAMESTLSLPFARIERISLALGRRRAGDVLIELKAGDRVPFVKLWPLAFGFWSRAGARPLLRAVPDAAVVGGLLARAAFAAAKDDRSAPSAAPFRATTQTDAAEPMRLDPAHGRARAPIERRSGSAAF